MNRRVLIGCEMSGEVCHAFARLGWEAVSADLLPGEKPDMDYRSISRSEGGWHFLNGEFHGSARHYQGDVRDLFSWDHPLNARRLKLRNTAGILRDNPVPLFNLAVLHPPCDHLALAGARYWRVKREPQFDQDSGEYTLPSIQDEAAAFFMEMVNAPAPLVAVENPVGIMGRKKEPLYRVPDQVVEPWWFGDPLAKKTCLWLKGLPLLVADNPVEPTGRVATGGGSHRTDIKNGRAAMNQVHEDRRGRKFRKVERSRTLPGFARAMAEQWTRFVEEQERAA